MTPLNPPPRRRGDPVRNVRVPAPVAAALATLPAAPDLVRCALTSLHALPPGVDLRPRRPGEGGYRDGVWTLRISDEIWRRVLDRALELRLRSAGDLVCRVAEWVARECPRDDSVT